MKNSVLVIISMVFLFSAIPLVSQSTDGDNIGREGGENVLFSQIIDLYGSASSRYVFRTTGSSETRASDHDLYQQLSLKASFPASRMFDFIFVGALREDLDGGRDTGGFSFYEDIGDTGTTAFFPYLYEAHIDANYLLPFLRQVRLGRQSGLRGEVLFFDGLSAEMEFLQFLNIAVYGGRAAHLFELNTQWASDLLAGAGVDVFPFKNANFSIDYLFVRDEKNEDPASVSYNHHLAFKTQFRFFTFLRTGAELSLQNWLFHEASVKTIATFPNAALEFRLKYYLKYDNQPDLVTELSPYAGLFGDSQPYHTVRGGVRKGLGNIFVLDIGFLIRRLLNQEETDKYNQNYSRFYTAVSADDLFFNGFLVSLSGDLWISDNKRNFSIGFDTGYRFQQIVKDAEITVGTVLYLNSYDYYPETELQDTTPLAYIRLKFPIGNHLSIEAKYDFETTIESFEPSHSLRLGMRYVF